MKKLVSALLISVLTLSMFTACSNSAQQPAGETPAQIESEQPASENPDQAEEQNQTENTVIKVGATPAPHAEILVIAKEILAEQGYDLQIVEYNDYVIPNTATDSGEIDANYFQHLAYLSDFNAEKGTKLASVAEIHYEPLGLYPGKTSSLDELADGAMVAVPNDSTNEARALQLLQAQGLIKLSDGVGLRATVLDIIENPKNITIKEIEAAQLARSLQDVDVAVINGNYAIQAGLKVKDALAVEDKDSDAAQTFANALVVKEGNESNPGILALVEALKTDTIKEFIETKYEGAVVPLF